MTGRRRDLEHRLPNALVRNPSDAPRAVEGLENARLMAKEHPDTFFAPSDAQIQRLKPGDLVQIARNGERFWVRLTGWVGKKWHGTVSNYLINNDDLPYGTSIYFYKKNIYNVMRQGMLAKLKRILGLS